MKIVIAPDSFKGSLTAAEACDAMEKGVRNAVPAAHIIKIPMADGGEGTVTALVSATGGSLQFQNVHGPLGDEVTAHYGILGDGKTAVIEMAAASGLTLVPPGKRNPLFTTTYGTGELIATAAEKGCRAFIIGIGGSATNDCGAGMAQALGVTFYNKSGSRINDWMNGHWLGETGQIDLTGLSPILKESRFTAACDVDNPLLGPRGCAFVYSPQKCSPRLGTGKVKSIAEKLETNMAAFSDLLEAAVDRRVRNIEGAGAAGGLGAGLLAFTGGKLQKGIDIILKTSDFAERIKGASLILTGEGKIDYQTTCGKTLSGIAREAKKQGIPVVAIAGMVTGNIKNLYDMGITSCFSICGRSLDRATAMKEAADLLPRISKKAVRSFLTHYSRG